MSGLPQRVEAVLYARVSSEEQEREGYSIPAQQELLRDYARERGFVVVHEFTDIESAGSPGREQFTAMLDFLRKSKTCRMILVEKTDRLYRNIKDYTYIDDLRVDVHLVRTRQVIGPDSDSSMHLMHLIEVGQARGYLQNLSREVKKGMRMKAKLGMYPSAAPFGYMNQIADGGKHIMVPDPKHAETVGKAFELYASDRYSLDELVAELRSAGYTTKSGKKFTRSEVQRLLRRRTYSGDFIWNDEIYPGTYVPLVSKEMWNRVQAILDRRLGVRKGSGKKEFAFSGLVHCGHCGCLLVGELKKDRYVYYHCTYYKQKCPERYVRQEEMERQFVGVLRQLAFDDNVMSLIVDTLRVSHASQREFHEHAVKRLQVEYAKLDNRIDKMYDDKLDGLIDAHTFERKSAGLRSDQSRILEQIQSHQNATQKYQIDGARLLDLARRAHEMFESRPASEQRKLLGFLLSNSTWKDGELSVTLRQPFDRLQVTVAAAGATLGAEGAESARSENWLGDRESNPDSPVQSRLSYH